MPFFFYAAGTLLLCSIFLFLWMRWRMRASKGRFSLTVVSALTTCLLTGLSAVTSSLPASIASKISVALGHGTIEGGVPSAIALILTAAAMIMIYRFGVFTIRYWETPPRVSDINLAEKHLENNIAALAIEQIKLLTKGQVDPLASDAVANWKEKTTEVPLPSSIKNLLRDMLVSAIGEIRIPDDGWRDDGKLWVGKILGLRSEDTRPIIVFVFDTQPTEIALKKRLEQLGNKSNELNEFKFYSVYMSEKSHEVDISNIEVSEQHITVLSSRQMILKGLDLLNYAREIIDTFERTSVGGTTATLKESYVDLKVDINEREGPPSNLSEKLLNWLAEPNGEHIALTGEFGQGKSTALLKFCYDWAKRFVESGVIGERVPLLIELRGQSPFETDPLGFLSPWCARYRLHPQQVFNLIKAGDAVVIFEGFDELRNAGLAFYRHQHFNALWRFAYPGTKIIFTGRPNFFLDQEEANRTLRSHEARKLGGDAFTSIWKLRKLDQDQIICACRGYETGTIEGISNSIRTSPDFLDIVSRPSMLPVVATIWGDIYDIQRSGTTLTGAVLIEKYIQAIFSRKEAELEQDRIRNDAPSGSRYLVLPKPVRELLTICVAWRMAGLKAKNTIPRSEIISMIRDVYDVLNTTSKSADVTPTIAEGLIEFEKRFADASPAERVEVIAAEICSAGLLVPDAVGGASNLRFPHKQFFEFLVAKGIAIRTSPHQLLASRIIEKSSNGNSIAERLKSEPNSISYLTYCIGNNLKQIISPVTRASMSISLLFEISLLRALSVIPTIQRNSNFLRKITDLEYSLHEELTKLNVQFNYIIPMITTASLAIALIISIGSSDWSSEKILVLSTLVLSVFLSSIFGLFMSKDTDNFGVIHKFIRAHWKKNGFTPDSRFEMLTLSYLSLRDGRVQINKSNTIDEAYQNYDSFLYPAMEFGRE